MQTPPDAAPSRSRRGCASLLGAAALLLTLAGGAWWWSGQRALDAQAEAAREAFAPALEQLSARAVEPERYDLDETIRVIHELERAAAESASLPEWLGRLGATDYSQVAPEVREARRELLDVLMGLYAAQVELEDQEALWELSSSMLLLSALSVVDVEGSIDPLSPSGAVSVDRDQAQAMLNDAVARQSERARLQRQLRGAEVELLEANLRWSEVWHRYLEEWDRLCLLRDRAYLAAAAGDWGAAAAAADAAIALAPSEREAHLLRAWAAIEGGEVDTPEGAAATRDMLAQLLDEHPDRSAPTLLLLGALEARVGDPAEARLHLDQAASLYPKQAALLADMLDPYRARAWLRRSEQGGQILDVYQSTMLGAGWFSPELQRARLAFDAGDEEAGRRLVLGHFSRRRGQKEWDALVSDLVYAHDLLGEHYQAIFPEDHWLDLEAKESTFGSSYGVKVHNRSDRALHNVSLVLALRFTDMYADDMQTFVVGRTQPELAPHARTDFGSIDIEYPLFGDTKTVDDVVTARAVLVSDEAVIWVDSDRFRVAQATERRARGRAPEPEATSFTSRAKQSAQAQAEALTRRAAEGARLKVEPGLLSDGLAIRLPRELLWLRPLFRLRYGDEEQAVSENLLEGDDIQLRFEGVGDLDDIDEPADLSLIAETPYGALVLTWRLSPDGTARLVDASFGEGS